MSLRATTRREADLAGRHRCSLSQPSAPGALRLREPLTLRRQLGLRFLRIPGAAFRPGALSSGFQLPNRLAKPDDQLGLGGLVASPLRVRSGANSLCGSFQPALERGDGFAGNFADSLPPSFDVAEAALCRGKIRGGVQGLGLGE